MNSLQLAIQSVAPLLLMIVLGALLRWVRWISEPGAKQIDKLCFRLLLPLTLFKNIYGSDFQTAFDWKLILIAILLTTLSFSLALSLSYIREKAPAKRAALAQSIFRNNCVVFGLPIMAAMYTQAEVSMFSLILAFVIPLNNVLAVVLLSMLTNQRISLRELARRVFSNPFVIFNIAALLVKLTGVVLPQFAVKALSDLAGAAIPIALLSLGAGLRFQAIRRDAGTIAFGVVARLALLPLLCIPILVTMGIHGAPLVAFFFILGTPSAVASYIMANQMGADGELAGHLVVFQSALSTLTIFLALLTLSTLGLT